MMKNKNQVIQKVKSALNRSKNMYFHKSELNLK